MKKTQQTRAVSLAGKLSAMTLALGAMAPLPAALAPLSGVATAHAQTNPCAPPPPKATNPCAPQPAAAPANPCAPAANPCAPAANPCAPAAPVKKKAKKKCDTTPANPCAPAPKCDDNGQG